MCCGWANRGLALGDGRVYVARMDATLVALSQQDGHVLWSASNGNPQDGYTMTMAPLYYNGLVIVGVSGGEFGARGSVTAYDARDGHLVWRFYTVPAPGQLGSDTWPANNEWQTGGATVWNTPSVDPKLGLLYFTTGNAYPWSTRGAGDNLFTSSFVALDAATGAYRWHYQVVHHDIWDYDCASNTVLFATRIRGLVRRVVAEPCKTGWVYELNRRTGRPTLEIEEKPVPQNEFQHTSATQPIPSGDSFTTQCARRSSFPSIASDGRPFKFGCIFTPFDERAFTAVAPGAAGANSWSPASYSPQTTNLYVCSRDTQSAYKAIPVASGTYSGGRPFVGVSLSVPFVREITPGAFTAVDMRTNRIVWRRRFTRTTHGQLDASCTSGSLATAGGLVFLGLPQGVLPRARRVRRVDGQAAVALEHGRRHRGAARELQRRREAVRRGVRRRPRRARTARRQRRRRLRVYARPELEDLEDAAHAGLLQIGLDDASVRQRAAVVEEEQEHLLLPRLERRREADLLAGAGPRAGAEREAVHLRRPRSGS